MDFTTYKTRVESDVSNLSQIEKLAVCLNCCRRLSPLYETFSVHHGWGDNRPFAIARDQATEFLSGTIQSFSVGTDSLEPLIPDMEDFGSIPGSFALNSGCAHLALIRQLDANEPEPTIDALLMCYETIHFCVQEEMDPTCSRSIPLPDIDGHEMMSREIDFQLDLISDIRGQSDLVQFTNNLDDRGLAEYMLNIERSSIAR